MRVLVAGRTGQLALALQRRLPADGHAVTALEAPELDLTDRASIAQAVEAANPDAIVNAAAYTAVDRAEQEPQAAFALNADMPGRFAAAAAAQSAPFVQISTDYVFDGSKGEPYIETDPLAPLGVYGASKAEGERRALAAGGACGVLRTAWVYGAHGSNFVKTMMRLGAVRDEVSVVADQLGGPTWSRDVAEGALRLAAALAERRVAGGRAFHCVGGGAATWADLAEAVFDAQRARGAPAARVRRITTAEFPTLAPRPADSRLDCSGLEQALGWRPGPWRERLKTLFATDPPQV